MKTYGKDYTISIGGKPIISMTRSGRFETESVWYDGRHQARVLKHYPDGRVRIAFKDQNLIPPEMDVPVEHLSRWSGEKYANPEVECPKCQVAWKETMLARFPVYDCPRCGMKKEEACSSNS